MSKKDLNPEKLPKPWQRILLKIKREVEGEVATTCDS